MLAKLAVRNVRRSARDYAIYFVTVALGVALFYAFNAIKSQAVLFDALSADSLRMLELLNMMIGLFSGVVACVLGFLVVYANRFLIRRRRREFGTYLMLGMGAGKVSRILLYETAAVGLLSLATGLAVGIALSQGLSFATAALMGTTMQKYQFIVSGEAIALTALCFVIIFAVSAVVDIIYIRRCKLATLLSAHESSECGRPINVPIRIAGFVASLVVLALAYWQLVENGLVEADYHFALATGLMVVGTFLFFWSVAGFVIAALTSAKGFYFKNIRMFTVRQISSKINTAFASMAVLSIMLFFALSVSSIGLGLVDLFVGNLAAATRYDATILAQTHLIGNPEVDDGSAAADYELYHGDMAACLAAKSPLWDQVIDRSAQIDYLDADFTYGDLVDDVPNAGSIFKGDIEDVKKTNVYVIAESQFNDACSLLGEKTVQLSPDEFAVNNTQSGTEDLARAIVSNVSTVDVEGRTLQAASTLYEVPMRTSAISDVAIEIIVPDDIAASIAKNRGVNFTYLDAMYSCDRAQGDTQFATMLENAFPPQGDEDQSSTIDAHFTRTPWPVWSVYTALGMIDQASGLRMVITYLALYIGFVLLVATAAILAIQQLSETADSLPRYRRLYALGCDEKRIYASLRAQNIVYFLAPLVVAACHTACAVCVVSSVLFAELGVDITGAIALSAGIVAIVYGIYLVVSYLLSKSIVKSALSERIQ